jgi:hypothetical protein
MCPHLLSSQPDQYCYLHWWKLPDQRSHCQPCHYYRTRLIPLLHRCWFRLHQQRQRRLRHFRQLHLRHLCHWKPLRLYQPHRSKRPPHYLLRHWCQLHHPRPYLLC